MHFQDPYWKGLAAYRAAQLDIALASFTRVNSAPAWFYRGNTLMRLSKFPEAIAAYQQALAMQAGFTEAQANLALAQAMLKDREAQQQAQPPEVKPDEIKFDNDARQGAKVQQKTPMAQGDQQWLDNLNTSPALFLKRKFALQQQAQQP
jgi:Ca-activated chloride channel family protein